MEFRDPLHSLHTSIESKSSAELSRTTVLRGFYSGQKYSPGVDFAPHPPQPRRRMLHSGTCSTYARPNNTRIYSGIRAFTRDYAGPNNTRIYSGITQSARERVYCHMYVNQYACTRVLASVEAAVLASSIQNSSSLARWDDADPPLPGLKLSLNNTRIYSGLRGTQQYAHLLGNLAASRKMNTAASRKMKGIPNLQN